ncbi:relaxase/mobilization nuclease domain-containing protein [Roseateles sp. DC23W]|uniref:Relaxase/mobilization nuclease domain-containing protein n=1 Tax=Pelomonas dachongensis TaxID=3299029 RepID=A0ABW7EGW1_9BURK
MPAGTDANLLQNAVREFAQVELAGHRYVMVLHDHQANPHVHLSVRAESDSGTRLNPRKTDLHRWRETFAEKLRGWDIEAEASRQPSRGVSRNYEPLWRLKARQEGRLQVARAPTKIGGPAVRTRAEAMANWAHIMKALGRSELASDRALAERVADFVRGTPFVRELAGRVRTNAEPGRQQSLPGLERSSGPDRTR